MPEYPNDQPPLYGNDRGAPQMIRGAYLSPDGCYRYQLWRVWDESLPGVTWIMLNPSTADHEVDDPTIVRCVDYARRWGYGRMDVFNLFALRSTDPRQLWTHTEALAIGPQTDEYLMGHLVVRGPMLTYANNGLSRPHADIVVCAWGAHGARTNRTTRVLRMLNDAGVFTHRVGQLLTKEGQPRHPLYLRRDEVPVLFRTDA